MSARIVFVVAGLPVPQGALVRSPAGGLYNRNGKNLDAWRQAIATEARAASRDWQLLGDAVELRATFRFLRPKSHFRADGVTLRPSAPAYPVTPPDLSKVLRALEDALSRVLYADDKQIVDLVIRKRFAEPGQQPGVSVEVAERLP